MVTAQGKLTDVAIRNAKPKDRPASCSMGVVERPGRQGLPSDIIERQLAHAERNKIKAAYNRAQHLPERRWMMHAWADYLDGLRAGGEVVAIRRPLV